MTYKTYMYKGEEYCITWYAHLDINVKAGSYTNVKAGSYTKLEYMCVWLVVFTVNDLGIQGFREVWIHQNTQNTVSGVIGVSTKDFLTESYVVSKMKVHDIHFQMKCCCVILSSNMENLKIIFLWKQNSLINNNLTPADMTTWLSNIWWKKWGNKLNIQSSTDCMLLW